MARAPKDCPCAKQRESQDLKLANIDLVVYTARLHICGFVLPRQARLPGGSAAARVMDREASAAPRREMLEEP